MMGINIKAAGPQASGKPSAQDLYEAISETIDESSAWTLLKLKAAYHERPDWDELEPDLQALFAALARKL